MKALCIVALIAAMFSCSKKSSESANGCPAAVILYSDPLHDGFGWTLKLGDGTVVVPDNLSENFQGDSLRVNVCFEKTGEKARCRCFDPPDVVHITNISLR